MTLEDAQKLLPGTFVNVRRLSDQRVIAARTTGFANFDPMRGLWAIPVRVGVFGGWPLELAPSVTDVSLADDSSPFEREPYYPRHAQ